MVTRRAHSLHTLTALSSWLALSACGQKHADLLSDDPASSEGPDAAASEADKAAGPSSHHKPSKPAAGGVETDAGSADAPNAAEPKGGSSDGGLSGSPTNASQNGEPNGTDPSLPAANGESVDAGGQDAALCGGSVCTTGHVCCPSGLPCADSCVPDCRDGAPCPSNLECSETSGVCEPAGGMTMPSGPSAPSGSMPADPGGPPSGSGSQPPPGGSMTGPGGSGPQPGGSMTGPGGSGPQPSGSMSGPAPSGSMGGPGGPGGGDPGTGGAGSAGGASGSESCDVPSGDGALEAFYSKGSVANAFWQGNSAAIDCDTFAIGDPTVSDGAAKAGKVHVYAWDGAAWSEQDHLAITSPYTVDLFGSSVALEGDTLVAGAPHRNACDKPDCTQSVGMAYIFTRSGSTWTQTKELASASQHYLALYGMSVAISGSTIAVAAPWQRVPTVNDDGSTSTKNQGGMVEIWTKGPKNWVYSTNIIAPGLQSSEYAGTGLALSGETLVIGAPGNLDQSIARPGRVFVYSGAGSTWEHQATLLADDGDKGDGFGHSVAYASDLVVVGAPQRNLTVSAGDAGGLLADVGGVYVFSGSGADLTQTAILEAPNAVAGAEFGYSLAAVSSTRVVVGAPGVKSVYVFDQLDGTWTLTATHTACSDGLGGGSLAAFGNFAVTATKEDSPGAWLIDLADPDTSCIE